MLAPQLAVGWLPIQGAGTPARQQKQSADASGVAPVSMQQYQQALMPLCILCCGCPLRCRHDNPENKKGTVWVCFANGTEAPLEGGSTAAALR
jgi:hypothetical protein